MPIEKWPKDTSHLSEGFVRCWHDGLNCAHSCQPGHCHRKEEAAKTPDAKESMA